VEIVSDFDVYLPYVGASPLIWVTIVKIIDDDFYVEALVPNL
jgi:hypothetical protein